MTAVATATQTEAKAWATAQARATLAGYTAELIETDEGRTALVVSRWALTRCLRTIEEAEAWIVSATGDARG